MKTNAYVQNKHPQMVNTEFVLRVVRYDCKVTVIKRWLIYDVRNFYSFRISPVCLSAWSRRHLDCNWHRKPISVGYVWRECFETARIHDNNLPYVRNDNNCHLSTASRKQALWWHNTKGCKSQRRQEAQESTCTRRWEVLYLFLWNIFE